MTPTFPTLYLLIMTLVVALVGTIDAAISREWDLFVVFVMVDALVVALLARNRGRRPSVPIRGDLVNWLRQRAAITGDSIEALVDRAVASFRQSTDPDYTHRHSDTSTKAESGLARREGKRG